MAGWQEIYSRSLENATVLYISLERDLDNFATNIKVLEDLLKIMELQIFNDDAREDMKKFTENVDVEYEKQRDAIGAEVSRSTDLAEERGALSKIDVVDKWRVGEILMHHWNLSKQYSLLPAGGE